MALRLGCVVAVCALGVGSLSGCGFPEPARESVVEGPAPSLVSWSGSVDCCGEDPHPVHGALLSDGSVAMVGKAAAGGEQTAGFLTRWIPATEPAEGQFVDEADSVVVGTFMLDQDSGLLQVAEVDGVVVAVGFAAASASAPAYGLALALDPLTLEPLAELRVSALEEGASAALESVVVGDSGTVVLGGSWGSSRAEMEGFKSYGNLVGGRGLALRLNLQDWLAAGGGASTPADLSAEILELPELRSLKSLALAADGRVFTVGQDEEERSAMLSIAADWQNHGFVAFDDGYELTDLELIDDASLALVGHGGDDTIDGHLKLVDLEGAVLWATDFGNPGIDADEVPSGGLAPDRFIYDECWGVVRRGDEIVAACGSGIESCSQVSGSSSEKSQCRDDPRRSWRSYLVALDGDGDVRWSRADSFVESSGDAFESAAEFALVADDGSVFAIVDQVFGVGLARFAD